MEKLGWLEEVVFVVLLDDAELIGIGERTEMDRCRVHGSGDVHELEAERAARHSDIANVAHESDVGIVDGDVEIDLIVEASGLIRTGGAWGFFILRGKDLLSAARGIKERGSSHHRDCAGKNP